MRDLSVEEAKKVAQSAIDRLINEGHAQRKTVDGEIMIELNHAAFEKLMQFAEEAAAKAVCDA